MNSADYVAEQIEKMKSDGVDLSEVAWKTALNCVGWAYVFGARGEYCSPANRRKYYASKGKEHPTIKTACKNFDGSGSCSGCKWFPNGKKTRFFDCRGFTYWVILQVFGFKIMGAGATSQWNTEANWKAKGEISTMPKDTLCCLFVAKGKTMSHTGFGLNDETVECSAGVQHFTKRKSKWSHWAVPSCVDGTIDPGEKPTLRRGSKGAFVTLLQTMLIQKGFSCGSYGADGDFGKATEAAVKAFQKSHNLTADGVCGPTTWAALETAEPFFSITIPHLFKSQADALKSQYPDSTIIEERG